MIEKSTKRQFNKALKFKITQKQEREPQSKG